MKLSDLIEEHGQPISESILIELHKREKAVLDLVIRSEISFASLLMLEQDALVNILINHIAVYRLTKQLGIPWQIILSLDTEIYPNLSDLGFLIKCAHIPLEKILTMSKEFRSKFLRMPLRVADFYNIPLEELMSLNPEELDKVLLNSEGVAILRRKADISFKTILDIESSVFPELFENIVYDGDRIYYNCFNIAELISEGISLVEFLNLELSNRKFVLQNTSEIVKLIRKLKFTLNEILTINLPWFDLPGGLSKLLVDADIPLDILLGLKHDFYIQLATHAPVVVELLRKVNIPLSQLLSLREDLWKVLFVYEFNPYCDGYYWYPGDQDRHWDSMLFQSPDILDRLLRMKIVSLETFSFLEPANIAQLFYVFAVSETFLDSAETCDAYLMSDVSREEWSEINRRFLVYLNTKPKKTVRTEKEYSILAKNRQLYKYLILNNIISERQFFFIALNNCSFDVIFSFLKSKVTSYQKIPQSYQIKSKTITGLIEELQQLEWLYEKVKLLSINNLLINNFLSESAFLIPAPFFCDATIHCDAQLFVRISMNLQSVSYNRVETYRLKYWFKLILANAINQVFRNHTGGGIEKSKITAQPIKCEGINEREYLFDYKIQFYDAYKEINLIQDNLDVILSSEGFAYLSGYFSLEFFDIMQKKCKEIKHNNSHKLPRIKRFNARITPVDNNFQNFDGNYVMRVNNNIVAISEGPDEGDVESVARFFYDLISESSEHASKKIVILAFGAFDIEFFRYVISRDYVYNDKEIEVGSRKSLGSKNVDAYQLNINGKKACVYNLTSMPDGETANIDYSDLHLLNEIYSTNNCIFLHHCRAGLGRSAAFAISAILYMHLPKILKTIESHHQANNVLSEYDLFNLIINPVLEIFNNRTVSPRKEQILQAIKVAFNLFSIKILNDVDYNEFRSDFSKVTLATLIDYVNCSNFLEENLPDERGIFDQFPFISDEWKLQYIQSKYHSFYSSIIEQMKIINHCFLFNIPIDILPDEYLRLCLQSAQVKDGILIEAQAILQIVLTFNLIIAILDLKNFDLGFRCYYLTSDTKIVADTFDPSEVPKNVPILRLVCINNYFSSVQKHPSLTMGAIRDGFIDPCLFLVSASSSSFWGRQMTMLSKKYHVTYEGNMNEREEIDCGY